MFSALGKKLCRPVWTEEKNAKRCISKRLCFRWWCTEQQFTKSKSEHVFRLYFKKNNVYTNFVLSNQILRPGQLFFIVLSCWPFSRRNSNEKYPFNFAGIKKCFADECDFLMMFWLTEKKTMALWCGGCLIGNEMKHAMGIQKSNCFFCAGLAIEFVELFRIDCQFCMIVTWMNIFAVF